MKKADTSAQDSKEDLSHKQVGEGATDEHAKTVVDAEPEDTNTDKASQVDEVTSKIPQAQKDDVEDEAKSLSKSNAASTQPHVGTPPKPMTRETQMEHLQSMFPAFHKITISDIMKARRNNIESAIQFLLELSDSSSEPRRFEPNTMTDAQIAQLLQERERYRAYVTQLRANNNGPDAASRDSNQLRYSPRVRQQHGRPTATPLTPAGPPPPLPSRTPDISMWPSSEEARQWKEDFNRFTEVGLAKVGTTLSNLRQKAETALRQHDNQNRTNSPGFFRHRTPTSQGSSSFQQDAHGRGNGHAWTVSPIYRTRPMYDNDPKPVDDEELESLVDKPLHRHARSSKDGLEDSSPLPHFPSKERAPVEKMATPTKSSVPAWGQRYSSKSQCTASEAKDHALGSQAISSSKDKAEEERSSDSQPQESPAASKSQGNEAQKTPSKDSSDMSKKNSETGEHAKIQPSEPEDDDFVENPFDDDD